MKTIYLLGCAWGQVPSIMDVALESLGTREFLIYKNIPVPDEPNTELIRKWHQFKTFEPGETLPLTESNLAFGVTGPRAKHGVYEYFRENFGADESFYMNIIHHTCHIATSSQWNRGIFVGPGVLISSLVNIGYGVTIKLGARIGHNVRIDDYVEINPGVYLAGNCKVERGCILGMGCIIKNSVTIGSNSFIGMGSVVTKDIPPGVIAYGNPCQIIRPNDKWHI
jgi:sugar O-acyltransferase (sialic acid O-acetyltransferase NeuD family)